MEEKKYLNKIICLFFPPLINNFDFQSREKVKFFYYKKDTISQFFSEVEGEKRYEKLVLINYPQTAEQLTELQNELTKIEREITNIVFCNLRDYNLIAEIQNKYLICPHCQKTFEKKLTTNENGQFVCPGDNQVFSREKVSSFNEIFLTSYFKNSKIIVEKILTKKNSSITTEELIIQKKEEVISGEIREKIYNLINNI